MTVADPADDKSMVVLLPLPRNISAPDILMNGEDWQGISVVGIIENPIEENDPVLTIKAGLEVISCYPATGRAAALQTGISFAASKGFTHVLPADISCMLAPEEIRKIAAAIKENNPQVLIGKRQERKEKNESGPGFLHRLFRLSFQAQTGLRYPEYFSGCTVYPIVPLQSLSFITSGPLVDLELMTRAVWAGLPVQEVLLPGHNQFSLRRYPYETGWGFFLRYGLFHLYFLFLAFSFYRPRLFFQSVRKTNIRAWIRQHVLASGETNQMIAWTVAFGVFMGLSPFHGFKLILLLTIGIWLRMNKPLLILASYIGMPPLIPFIIFFSQGIGGYILSRPNVLRFSTDMQLSLDFVWNNLFQQMVGGVSLATAGGLAFGMTTFLFLKLSGRKNP